MVSQLWINNVVYPIGIYTLCPSCVVIPQKGLQRFQHLKVDLPFLSRGINIIRSCPGKNNLIQKFSIGYVADITGIVRHQPFQLSGLVINHGLAKIAHRTKAKHVRKRGNR